MTIKNIIAALAIIAMPTFTFAQEKSNQQLSTEYKYKISALKSEIKTPKSKIKLQPGNAAFVTDMNTKKAELKTAQSEKKVIDKAIKTEKAQRKAAEKGVTPQQYVDEIWHLDKVTVEVDPESFNE